MKIYKSNYRNHWISPYTVLEKALWWKPWKHIEYDEPWVQRWVDRIEPISKAVRKVLDWVHPQINYVKIDRYDTWNMDSTLAPIILPMLVQLQQTKHGSPFVDDEDVPEHFGLRSTQAPPKADEWDVDGNHHLRWDWVLDEMIWAFEQLQPDCDWERLYETGHCDFVWEKVAGSDVSEMKHGPNHTLEINLEGRKLHEERIQRGTTLFGKYYRALWD
jgi:hypothetical protein